MVSICVVKVYVERAVEDTARHKVKNAKQGTTMSLPSQITTFKNNNQEFIYILIRDVTRGKPVVGKDRPLPWPGVAHAALRPLFKGRLSRAENNTYYSSNLPIVDEDQRSSTKLKRCIRVFEVIDGLAYSKNLVRPISGCKRHYHRDFKMA